MREAVTISELDLALVNALQLRPRASWSELSPLLGVTAGTLARRWERLTRAGLAWVYAAPGRESTRNRCTAFVLLRCLPQERSRLMTELSALPEAVTIELAGPGSADLLLDVPAPDLPSLSRFLSEELDRLSGIVSVSCLFATSLYVEGSRWRLRSLDPAQLTALGGGGGSRSVRSHSIPSTGPCSTSWSATAASARPNSPSGPPPARPPSAAYAVSRTLPS
jgi:DNA-binding Lrp family transcriptional regulator